MIRELGNMKGAEFEKYNLPKTEIVGVRSTDGLFELLVAITYPVNFDPTKKNTRY
jgi:dipeptidyl-peptidase-4